MLPKNLLIPLFLTNCPLSNKEVNSFFSSFVPNIDFALPVGDSMYKYGLNGTVNEALLPSLSQVLICIDFFWLSQKAFLYISVVAVDKET